MARRQGLVALLLLALGHGAQGQAGAGAPDEYAVLAALVEEAVGANPEVVAAQRELDAAQARIAPASALDDPMVEAGVLNLPVPSFSFRREDMTMKMLGLSQRLPYPGKRGARGEVASKEAEVARLRYAQSVNRVVRDVKRAYFDLAFVVEATRLAEKTRTVLEQFVSIAQARYAVGQGAQSDVLKAQTQLSRIADELLRRSRERPVLEAEMARALGRSVPGAMPEPQPLESSDVSLDPEALAQQALAARPEVLIQRRMIERAGRALDLARLDYYPDFDVKLSLGQRDSTPSGERRDEMLSFTVGINLPVWRRDKLDPRVREAVATQAQAAEMLRAQENDVRAQLRQQIATAEQSRRSVRLYDTSILPPARLAVEAGLSAYRVSRVDFLTLLDSQMTVFGLEVGRVQAIADFKKALVEIDFLSGLPGPPARSADGVR